MKRGGANELIFGMLEVEIHCTYTEKIVHLIAYCTVVQCSQTWENIPRFRGFGLGTSRERFLYNINI